MANFALLLESSTIWSNLITKPEMRAQACGYPDDTTRSIEANSMQKLFFYPYKLIEMRNCSFTCDQAVRLPTLEVKSQGTLQFARIEQNSNPELLMASISSSTDFLAENRLGMPLFTLAKYVAYCIAPSMSCSKKQLIRMDPAGLPRKLKSLSVSFESEGMVNVCLEQLH